MKTGNTILRGQEGFKDGLPQWSPAMKTGNTSRSVTTGRTSWRLNGARP